MNRLRTGLVVAALAALVLTVPAAASSTKSFHVEKDCVPPTCVITASTYKGIEAGSVITYSANGDGTLTALISAAHGTATGRCDLRPIFGSPSLPGSCVFASGTGSLTAFHLDVEVRTTNFVTWFWDGAYRMGQG
jgi:hypothetical protein